MKTRILKYVDKNGYSRTVTVKNLESTLKNIFQIDSPKKIIDAESQEVWKFEDCKHLVLHLG